MNKRYVAVRLTVLIFAVLIMTFAVLSVDAEDSEEETMPREYGEYIDSLPDSVADQMPEGVFSDESGEIERAASEIVSPTYFLSVLLRAFGARLEELLPTFALLCGIVILAAVMHTVSSHFSSGISSAVETCVKICAYCSIAGVAVASLDRFREYFEGLFASVAAFLPLSGVLYAMGGNLSTAVSGTATLSVILTVCQALCTTTVIPLFCLCLSLSLLTCFGGIGATSGQSISATVKRWYNTALGFVMMVLTTTLAAQSLITSKADGAAMRGIRFAMSGFVPLTGGTLSSTLGTLAASVELLRGSVGVIGIAVILLMLIPTVVELALLRLVCDTAAFIGGSLGCAGEQRLLSEIGGLYGYLEGVAALSGAIFIIAMGIFAATGVA